MASRPEKRQVWGILTALGALIILGGLAAIYLPTYRRSGILERRLSAFHANPCQKTADPLIDLLGKDDVTHEQATEILKALLQPKVVVEDSYITGQPVEIRVELENPIKLNILMVGSISSTLFIEGITGQDGIKESESLDIAPELSEHIFDLGLGGLTHTHILVSPDPPDAPFGSVIVTEPLRKPPIRIRKAGTYKGKVRLSYDTFGMFFPPPTPSFLERILTKLGLSKSQPPNLLSEDPLSDFKYSYEIPFQIRVVAPKTDG